MKNTKLIFIFLLLTLSQSLLLAQVVWDGGGDNLHWDDPLNWNTDAIPTASDDVEINALMAIVTIPAGYHAVAKSLINLGDFTIEAMASLSIDGTLITNGVRNDGDFLNEGILNVNNVANRSILNAATGHFINANEINMLLGLNSSGLDNQGVFDNQVSATIIGNLFQYAGVDNGGVGGIFNNYGSIELTSSFLGGILYNVAAFNNKPSGVITLTAGAIGLDNYNGPGPFINEGQINCYESGYSAINQQNTFENRASGIIDITNTDPMKLTHFSLNYGQVINDGMISISNVASGNAFHSQSGGGSYLRGSGSVTIDSYMEVHANFSPGNSPGTFTINGGLDVTGALAVYEAELASAISHDQIIVNGDLILGGALDVTLLGGFTPGPTNEFTIITYTGTLTNTFSSVSLPSPQMDDWIVDYGTAGEVVLKLDPLLPIESGTFRAVNYQNHVQLVWTTITELNNDHFMIQRSEDTKKWMDIATIKSHGNSKEVTNYEVNDNNPLSGISYYRLLQIDLDGKMTTSNIIALSRSARVANTSVYPNPTTGLVQVNYDEWEVLEIKVYNALGQLILSNTNSTTIDLSSLSNGIYYLKIKTNANLLHTQIALKKN